MEHVVWKRIRTPRKWSRQTNKKPNQHNQIHQKEGHSKKLQEISDIRAIHLQLATREKRKEQDKIHSRRIHNWLPRQSIHAHVRNADCQTPLQQCHIHKRFQIHDDRHIKLTPHEPNQATWIHPHTHQRHPRWNHCRIKTQRKRISKWGGIYRCQPWHVWITAVRNPSHQTPRKMTQQMRIPPKQISPRDLETRMSPGAFHIGRGRFQGKIGGGKTCNPTQANTRRKLHIHDRIGRQKIHQKYTRLGLQVNTIASFTTRLHQ